MSLRVLALEPYYGGAHRAFLDGWEQHSRHHFRRLTLPAHHWKWRMRHAALSFAEMLKGAPDVKADVLWASSMLNLAEVRGLIAPDLAKLPAVLYFHENQLSYPSARTDPRDVHFGFEEWVGAHAAQELWFNSQHNRNSWFQGLRSLLDKPPDRPWLPPLNALVEKAVVQAPGIEAPASTPVRSGTKLHVVWAARWEHDKGPELFFAAIERLASAGVSFALSVLGEVFHSRPPVFATALRSLSQAPNVELHRFGFVRERSEYYRALSEADVFVSTARHEFFGLAALEAQARGCVMLLPNRLVYPELYAPENLYDGEDELVERLQSLAAQKDARSDLSRPAPPVRFYWGERGPALDAALERVARADGTRSACDEPGPPPAEGA